MSDAIPVHEITSLILHDLLFTILISYIILLTAIIISIFVYIFNS